MKYLKSTAVLILLSINFSDILPTKTSDNIINISFNSDDQRNIAFFKEFDIENNTSKEINLHYNETSNFGYILFQVHSYIFDLTLSFDLNFIKGVQFGRNLGLILYENKKIFLRNSNVKKVSYVIAIVYYNSSSPVPGGCNLDGELSTSATLIVTTFKDMISVDTPSASLAIEEDPNQMLCSNAFNQSKLIYEGSYFYLPKGDFSEQTYFASVRKFLVPEHIKNAHKTSAIYPANRLVYLQIPNTGIVFNTIVHDENSKASYIPSLIYFCNSFVWKEECNRVSDDSVLKLLSIALIITGILKSFVNFMPFSCIYLNVILNCFPLGCYYSYSLVKYWNFTKLGITSTVIVGGILSCMLVCLLSVSFGNFFVGFFMYLSSTILFCWLFATNLLFLWGNIHSEHLYLTVFILTLLCCALFVFPYLQIVWLVINVIIGGFYLLFGMQILTNSNLIYIPLHYYGSTNYLNYNYVNAIPSPDKLDIFIFVGAMGFTLLGIILKTNKRIAIGRREISEEEEHLLSSRITELSDEVFLPSNVEENSIWKSFQNQSW